LAWNMWNLIEKLSELLWDRYDNEFIERYLILALIFTEHNSLRILARRSEIPMQGISKIS
ncbi:MAG: hypothetical protein ACYS0I_19440, partial [Planctomycetota bacterium]